MISKAKGGPSDPRNLGIDLRFQVHPIVLESQSKITVHALLHPPNCRRPCQIVATGRLLSIISLLHPNYIFIKRQSFHVVAGMGKFWAKPSISKFHAIYDLPRFARATTDSRRVRGTSGKSRQFSVQRTDFNLNQFSIVLLVWVESVMLMVEIFRQPTNLLIENQPYLEWGSQLTPVLQMVSKTSTSLVWYGRIKVWWIWVINIY